jgi:hypothetical protein
MTVSIPDEVIVSILCIIEFYSYIA